MPDPSPSNDEAATSEDESPTGTDLKDGGVETPAPADDADAKQSPPRSWLQPDSRSRRLIIGLAIYVACLVVFMLLAGDRITKHTSYNHYALLADAWLHGRHALLGGPPSYAGMNDFALYQSQWYISFPPFPAILMMPLVWLSGEPENFRDGQFIVWLAGIGPAVLFLVLEKLRRLARSSRSEVDNIRLALLFAFGTVYFFTAVQGTVWYAAHVVGVGLAALFVLFALDAERPTLAGAMIGCMFLTRVTTLLVGVFFVFEAIRVSYIRAGSGPSSDTRSFPSEGSLTDRIATVFRELDRAVLVRLLVRFTIPVLIAFAFASWINNARFHNPAPWAFGHEYLQVGWKTRIDRWGLFSYHFLPRNLSVMLASLPWKPLPSDVVPIEMLGMTFKVPHYMISGHGLALWFTTPIYLWLIRPGFGEAPKKKRKMDRFLWCAAAVAALGPMAMNLLYQNSGWFQFGYRFSNDYAIFLFVLLAISVRRLSRGFWIASAWAVLLNTFGAASFERAKYDAFYSHQPALSDHRYGPGGATLDLVYPPD